MFFILNHVYVTCINICRDFFHCMIDFFGFMRTPTQELSFAPIFTTTGPEHAKST